MIHETITLQIDEAQRTALTAANKALADHLEQRLPLKPAVLASLREQLTQVVAADPAWRRVLERIDGAGDHYCLRLLDDDNAILNLPWALAQDPVSGRTLGDVPRLRLGKCPASLAGDGETPAPALSPPPLKILVMIASPEDAEYKSRLSYEEEEFLILQALAPLMESGRVQVDFTDDGSLEALRRQLRAQRYHALHVSGHAVFQDGQAKLQLEQPLSLRTALVGGREFAEAVNGNPDYRVPLVVVSACQSAQGTSEKGLSGITNQLLRVGVPAVIAMGASVQDRYASLFAGRFYGAIAERQNIPSSFHDAMTLLRERERQDRAQAGAAPAEPLQWTIPNLYLKGPLEHLVDWQAPWETLRYTAHRYITQGDRLVLTHEKEFRFIGRRRDKATIMPAFFARKPIQLKGQGGVGKTALAEHLIQRLIAAEPDTEPFVFTETMGTLEAFSELLKGFLLKRKAFDATLYNGLDKARDKLLYLVAQVGSVCTPVFVFDNLESFQAGPNEPFKPEHEDVRDAIDVVSHAGSYHVILTGRYALPDFPYVTAFALNQVSLNDYWRRALTLLGADMARAAQTAAAAGTGSLTTWTGVDFFDIVKLLHGTFGGNYRALEMFATLFAAAPDRAAVALKDLEAFRTTYADATEEVRQEMGKNIAFDNLLRLVTTEQRQTLDLLRNFRIPVLSYALELQKPGRTTPVWEADLLGVCRSNSVGR